MSKIKVLHCLGQLNTGGAETLVMNVYRNINQDKYQFDFLLFNQNEGFYDKEVQSYGSTLYYLPSLSETGILNYVKGLVSFFKNNHFDVVHSHMDYLGGFIAYAAYQANVKKIIVHSHANQKMFEQTIIKKLLVSLNKALISRYSTTRLACSEEAGESLFNKEFEVLFNGVDFNKFQHPNMETVRKFKEEFKIKETNIVLGHVGSYSENKNQQFLIELMDELDERYKLILVGSKQNELKERTNNQRIIFAGVRSEIPELMNIFDCFLFPSKLEGLGIVAIEAQASGTYCIASTGVPTSADIQEELITFLPLEKELWLKEINKERNKNKLKTSSFEYGIKNTVKKLENIYS